MPEAQEVLHEGLFNPEHINSCLLLLRNTGCKQRVLDFSFIGVQGVNGEWGRESFSA